MDYDVIIIGGGLSGLTSGSLLSKRGLSVAVVEKGYNLGGPVIFLSWEIGPSTLELQCFMDL